jgi:uncharacterized protein YbjQ (UPF0145 family)
MLLSTLPELPGQTFRVKGIVCAQGVLGALRGDKIQKMMQSLTDQAEAVGADGIVDIRTILAGDTAHCVITGTAVEIQ